MTLRLALLGLLLGGEVLLFSLVYDGGTLDRGALGGLALLRDYGAWTLRWAVAATLVFLSLSLMRGQGPQADGPWPAWLWLAAHVPLAAGFFALGRALYANTLPGNAPVILWLLLAAATALTAAFTFLPPPAWLDWLRRTGPLWWMSALAGAAACSLGAAARLLWKPAALTTFALVKFMLGCFTDQMILQPERVRLGTPNFMVIISPECSGLEGMGLFLIFCLLWLVVFRHELRFPQALLLIPLGLTASYLLNAVRIFALLLIGHFGYRDIAVRGFHSQAGWIAFCLVAGGLLWLSLHVPWFAKHASSGARHAYPAAPYLAPFMALMAAGILSQALTAHFEWFYPLRLAVTVAVLIAFRAYYLQLDWRFGPWAVLTGVAVFVLWVSSAETAATGPPPELAAADPALRWAWIAARIVGAVVTVPIAEELAFRGFGLRRLVDEDFEHVEWRRWTWLALAISSTLFGLLHGGLWLAGIAAGLAYAAVAIRAKRIGEAVGAHAITNALLAGYVLATGKWGLW